MKAMLAKPLTLNPDLLLEDSGWVVEPKYDGERIIAMLSDTTVRCWNRHGTEMNVPTALAQTYPFGTIYLDGEIVNDVDFYAFDIIREDGTDMTKWTYYMRRKALEKVLQSWNPKGIWLADQAQTTYEKKMMARALELNGAEGVMFKNINGRYMEGKRSSKWLKWKYTNTADVVVLNFDFEGKRESVEFGYYDVTGQLVSGGSIKVSDLYHDDLNVGDVMEIKYLRYEPSGRLYQPTFIRKRTDKTAAECLQSQLV
jgi:ATP-dependent DNA ligase